MCSSSSKTTMKEDSDFESDNNLKMYTINVILKKGYIPAIHNSNFGEILREPPHSSKSSLKVQYNIPQIFG